MEKYAVKRGFLEENTFCDLESPNYAEQRWHLENGIDEETDLKLVLYSENAYHHESSVTAELDTPNITWRAYFKGPLIGHLKKEDRWFIGYSSADRYNWITELTSLGKYICFGLHCENVLCFLSFEDRKLYRYKAYRNEKIPVISSISITNASIILNEDSEITDAEPFPNRFSTKCQHYTE